jgi:Arc/MetJ-type ribon-helix-helix transcriptional regulator
MTDTTIRVDKERAKALKAAVSAGHAESVEAAVESAVDAWLVEQVLAQASDETLRRLWREGSDSGDAGELDFTMLKAEARRVFSAP